MLAKLCRQLDRAGGGNSTYLQLWASGQRLHYRQPLGDIFREKERTKNYSYFSRRLA